MRQLRKILFPFSLLYSGVTSIRNKLYDLGIFKSFSYSFSVICVGNLSVGGTGKSPMVEYLISLLKDDVRLGSLSRGYKRSTTGFQLLSGRETAEEVGDEPLQFKKKFPEVLVAVDEKRSRGISELRKLDPSPEVILLDDAFQHREVSAGLNILLTAYGDIYAEDYVLPAGNLRESRSGANRAQIIVVTKSPADLGWEDKQEIEKKLNLTVGQELYFGKIAYADVVFSTESSKSLISLKGTKFLLVTGIANPSPLVTKLTDLGLDFEHLAFPDHHNFKAGETSEINKHSLVLTTEKDFMRLNGQLDKEKLYYLPIKMEFLTAEEKESFDASIEKFTKKK